MSVRTATERQQFTGLMRFLHWLMAAMVLTMLGIGVAMVASLGDYHRLVSIHRPLGIAILILVVIRFVNRQFSTLPPFPANHVARRSALPHTRRKYCCIRCCLCCRWSAGGCCPRRDIRLSCSGRCIFSPILPHSVMLYAFLRRTHTVLAYLLFLAFIAHFGAILFHTLIVRDGMLSRMAPWRVRAR